MKSFATILLSLALTCCSAVGQTDAQPRTPPADPAKIDIYEAVLRYQIRLWDMNADSYCVEVNGKDAPVELLQRFQSPRVKGKSCCKKKNLKGLKLMDVVDKTTKKRSVIFDMGEIHWHARSEADVDGGYLCASQCFGSGSYHVVWDGRQWIVTNFDIHVQG